MSNFLLAYEDLIVMRDKLKTRGVDKVFFTVDELDGLELSEIPDPHVELIIKGEDIGEPLDKFSPSDGAGVLSILSHIALGDRNIEAVHINFKTEAE